MSSTTPPPKVTAAPPEPAPPASKDGYWIDLLANIKEFWISLAREDWAPKVEKRLTNNALLGECERDVAYAAWMQALSERKSKQLGVLSIPTAAIALVATLISIDTEGTAASWIGAGAVLLVAVIVGVQLMLTRDIEALRAAAAVHEHRASGCPGKSANDPDAIGPGDGPSDKSPADSAAEHKGGGTTPPPAA